jgi:YVTN family beta-propeller protein
MKHARVRFAAVAAAVVFLVAATPSSAPPGYHLVRTWALGGDGSWDYLTLDTAGHRLFIARQNRVMVVDPANGNLLGEIPGFSSAHGVAFAYATGHGFATSGADSTVLMFDLKTLKVLGRTTAAEDADAILYDGASKRVFTFNGDANSSSVIDAVTGQRIANIPLGGKPEFGVSAGDGKLYVNITDKGVVAEVDAAAMRVTRTWPIAPCENSTGLAIDVAHHRLISVCRNKYMAISDIVAGRLVTTLPIGAGVDAARFDVTTQLAFASNGEGTVTVVHEDSPDRWTIAETVQTQNGAKTMELDPASHRLYLGAARYGPAAPAAGGGRQGRPTILPGSFALLVFDRQ